MMWKTLGEGATEADQTLEAILVKVAAWSGREIRYQPVSGGISNANWRVNVANSPKDFFVKVPGRGTEMFTDRYYAHDASRKAYESGFGVPVVDFLPDEGVEIFEFIEGYRAANNIDFFDRTIRLNSLKALKAFNDSNSLALTKTIFDMIEEHFAQIAKLGGNVPPDFAWLKRKYRDARAALEASGLDLVPCMNDTIAGNFMIGPTNDIVIVDFEYASNNERSYELALWFGEMFFPHEIERELIEAYYGYCNQAMEARVTVLKGLADLKWGSWSMVQAAVSTLDFDYYKYGDWKHMRARNVFRHPDWNKWLRIL